MEAVPMLLQDNINDVVSDFLNTNSLQYKQELLDIGETTRNMFNNKTPLLKTRLGELLKEEVTNSTIEKDLIKMKRTLNKVSPTTNKITIVSSILTKIFGEGDASKKLIKMISKYQSAEEVINEIREALHKGQETLKMNNTELEKLKSHLKDQLGFIEYDVEVLQTIIKKLKTVRSKQENEKNAGNMTNHLLIKLQDFKIMQEATTQFILSINMTHENNGLLSGAIDRVCDITLQLMYSSLSIKAATENQKKVLDAMQATQEFASELLVQNADSLQDTVKRTNEIYTAPVLNLNKLKEAHKKLAQIVENSINTTAENKSRLLATIQELDELQPLSIMSTGRNCYEIPQK